MNKWTTEAGEPAPFSTEKLARAFEASPAEGPVLHAVLQRSGWYTDGRFFVYLGEGERIAVLKAATKTWAKRRKANGEGQERAAKISDQLHDYSRKEIVPQHPARPVAFRINEGGGRLVCLLAADGSRRVVGRGYLDTVQDRWPKAVFSLWGSKSTDLVVASVDGTLVGGIMPIRETAPEPDKYAVDIGPAHPGEPFEAYEQSGTRWITIGGDKSDPNDGGGTHVMIDDDGRIVAGPKALEGRSLKSLDRNVAGTSKDKRQDTPPPQATEKPSKGSGNLGKLKEAYRKAKQANPKLTADMVRKIAASGRDLLGTLEALAQKPNTLEQAAGLTEETATRLAEQIPGRTTSSMVKWAASKLGMTPGYEGKAGNYTWTLTDPQTGQEIRHSTNAPKGREPLTQLLKQLSSDQAKQLAQAAGKSQKKRSAGRSNRLGGVSQQLKKHMADLGIEGRDRQKDYAQLIAQTYKHEHDRWTRAVDAFQNAFELSGRDLAGAIQLARSEKIGDADGLQRAGIQVDQIAERLEQRYPEMLSPPGSPSTVDPEDAVYQWLKHGLPSEPKASDEEILDKTFEFADRNGFFEQGPAPEFDYSDLDTENVPFEALRTPGARRVMYAIEQHYRA